MKQDTITFIFTFFQTFVNFCITTSTATTAILSAEKLIERKISVFLQLYNEMVPSLSFSLQKIYFQNNGILLLAI